MANTPSSSTPDSEVSMSSAPASPPKGPTPPKAYSSAQNLAAYLPELFDENITAKAIRVAYRSLRRISSASPQDAELSPAGFPETVPQSGPDEGIYTLRDADFWTCGFFPGHLAALLERAVTHPQHMRTSMPPAEVCAALHRLTRIWSAPLHAMATRTDTHDLGFIIMPALRRNWELTHNRESLTAIVTAADSLASRFVPSASALRSWDVLRKKDITVTDQSANLLVIVDSLCNLDLLYYAAAHAARPDLAALATAHARTLLRTHLRREEPPKPSGLLSSRHPRRRDPPKNAYAGPQFSTHHLANLDPATGALRWHRTAQGHADASTWSRGQAWAVLGYAQTYTWTRDPVFLAAACGLAEYFLARLDDDADAVAGGRYVPPWDFDAPADADTADGRPVRDTSAGVIAANGLLVLSQALVAIGKHELSRRFFEAAIRIVRDTLDLSLAEEKARFVPQTKGEHEGRRPPPQGLDDVIAVEDVVPGRTFDSILKNGTANNNEQALRRLRDHGLVYGDYYLVEFGNRLMKMGLI
ncbi:hypothetical protein ACHAQA_002981 [Verticillium albo-atrum]